jgi:kinesin family protein 5
LNYINGKSGPANPTSSVVVQNEPNTLTKDQSAEFLQRENELEDQIAAKETELSAKLLLVKSLKEDLLKFKLREADLTSTNKELSIEVSALKVKLEKVDFEHKEAIIVIESLNDTKEVLETQLKLLQVILYSFKQKMTDMQSEIPDDVDIRNKEQMKTEKMAQMMAQFDPSSLLDSKDRDIQEAFTKIAQQEKVSMGKSDHSIPINGDIHISESDFKDLTVKLANTVLELAAEKERSGDLETRLRNFELEYQHLLENKIEEGSQFADVETSDEFTALKSKLENYYHAKSELHEAEKEALTIELDKKNEEISQLKSTVAAHVEKNVKLQAGFEAISDETALTKNDHEIELLKKSMAAQLTEFDTMKEKMMKELRSRCEKVIELEMSLDETRGQYANILKSSNSSLMQKKMAFMERNLEQLTNVQKQLVEQNSTLKKDILVCEKKLEARKERIETLERLLAESQHNLIVKEQKQEVELEKLRAKIKEVQGNKMINIKLIILSLHLGFKQAKLRNH